MQERSQRIKKVKEKTNNVEDELFAAFCEEIGVVNIRQYEERELQVQEDRAKKRLEFDNQKLRLQNQLEFEKSRDTRGEFKIFEYMPFFPTLLVFFSRRQKGLTTNHLHTQLDPFASKLMI